MWNDIKIIAEVKIKSPFGYVSEHSWEELFEIANEIGDILSIHTDERWGGSLKMLEKARKMTEKPILAKGIHETDQKVDNCLKIGADFVLVVGRIPALYQEKLLIEPLTLTDLSDIPKNLKVVWNSRDLATGGIKKETFDEARSVFAGWLCQASNVRTIHDVNQRANAVLVGTNLIEFVKSLIN